MKTDATEIARIGISIKGSVPVIIRQKYGSGNFLRATIFSVRQVYVSGERHCGRAATTDMRWFSCRIMICGCDS